MSTEKKYIFDRSKLINPFSWKSVKNFFQGLVTLKGKPSKIALSLALGVFIGIFMPIGFQLMFIVPLTMMFNLNVLIASTATFITNPLTVIPLYLAIIKTGEFLTQTKISWAKFENVIDNPSLNNFAGLGFDTLIVFFSGSLLLGVIISITVYFTAVRIITKQRLKRNNA